MENNKQELPLVSVVMPMHNAAKYLREAAQSILDQTYPNIEFVIIDDGSTDDSVSIIRSLNASCIKIHSYPEKQGLAKALNKGIELSSGEYIARMDADDISLNNRIEEQVKYMTENPDVGISGTQIIAIGNKARSLPVTHEEIKWYLLNACPFLHPSVIFKRSILLEHQLFYDPSYYGAEDLELWMRASHVTKLTNLDKAYVKYRYHFGMHQAMIDIVARLNTGIKINHLSWLLPALPDDVKSGLAVFMNRHIRQDRTVAWLEQGLALFKVSLDQYPEYVKELTGEFNRCLWFHFSSDPAFYKTSKGILKEHGWFRLSFKQQMWLFIKPLIKK